MFLSADRCFILTAPLDKKLKPSNHHDGIKVMGYLFFQIWLWLLFSSVFGFLIGGLIFRRGKPGQDPEKPPETRESAEALDIEATDIRVADMQTQLDQYRQRNAQLEYELDQAQVAGKQETEEPLVQKSVSLSHSPDIVDDSDDELGYEPFLQDENEIKGDSENINSEMYSDIQTELAESSQKNAELETALESISEEAAQREIEFASLQQSLMEEQENNQRRITDLESALKNANEFTDDQKRENESHRQSLTINLDESKQRIKNLEAAVKQADQLKVESQNIYHSTLTELEKSQQRIIELESIIDEANESRYVADFMDESDDERPEELTEPDGVADDLTLIKGVGPVLEKKLNSLGIFHFRQIAGFNEGNIKWMDKQLNFPGRVERGNWLDQAKKLIENDD